MPTTLRRIQVSLTPELDQAIDAASDTWPDEARSQLLTNLALLGATTLQAQRAEARQRRRRDLEALMGAFHGVYPPDYLERLREDWPA